MSVSRRKFLRAGSLVALSAALPISIFAQGFKGRDGNPGDQAQPDPLANYNKSAFSSYLNSIFELYTGYSVVEVTLVEVKDLLPSGSPATDGRESFSLLFRGGTAVLRQNTYRMQHPSLGGFQLFLVPGGPDSVGAQSYVAIINRLSYKDALNPAPVRASKTGGAGSTAPAQPVTAPTTTAPAQTAPPQPTVAPTEKPKPERKRKPSWKSGDSENFDGGTDQ
jgi:hypothetical protein